MKRANLYLIAFWWICCILRLHAQVGINTSSPDHPFQVNVDSTYMTPTLDQYTAGMNSLLTLSAGQSAGQSFIQGLSGPLWRVHIILSGGTGLVEVKISAGSSPGGAILATRSFNIPVVQMAEYAFEFTPAPVVNAGTPLFITVTNFSSGPMEWRKNSNNPYGSGQAWLHTGSWNALPADDMIFLTYVTQPDTLNFPAFMVTEDGAVALKSYTLPVTDGTTDQVIITNGQGQLEWKDATSLINSDRIYDADQDTRVMTEKNPDEDIIRFDIAGAERMTLSANANQVPRLELLTDSGNTLIGKSAGQTLNPQNGLGTKNTYVGQGTGQQTTTGYKNAAVGFGALMQNSGGFLNTAMGHEALRDNTTGGYNTAFGADAMRSNTDGTQNTAVGYNALLSNTTGDYHTAVGRSALSSNTTGSSNTGVGKHALFSNTSGSNNTAFGADAMRFNVSGQNNTAIGVNALLNTTTGSHLTAVGMDALRNNTTGQYNTAVGRDALRQNTNGDHNTAVGYEALRSNTTGYGNTATGDQALASNTDGVYNTAFGAFALEVNTWSYENSAFGYRALALNLGGNGNTAFGFHALTDNTTGYWNTAAGRSALAFNTTGYGNTAFGRNAHFYNTTGSQNTAIGLEALQHNTTGYSNTAVGAGALINNSTGYSRTGVGYGANTSNAELNFSTGLGFNAAPTAAYQVRIGHQNITSIGGYVGWSNLSDARFKAQVHEDVPGLAFIQRLRPVTYQMDTEGIAEFLADRHGVVDSLDRDNASGQSTIRYTGFIAQEVEAAAQAIGYDFSGVDKPKNEDDMYALRYAEFVVPLVKAVQEQQTLITSLQQELEQLRFALTTLQQSIPDTRD